MQNILIIEDETPAYQKLSGIMGEIVGDDYSHDWAKTCKQTRQYLTSGKSYQLIFADIQLGDGLSLDVFDQIEINSPIIFCSAYNDYLLEAFRTNGIAYILKPYDKADLAGALNKYNKLFTPGPELLKSLRNAVTNTGSHKERLVIKSPSGIKLLQTKDISLIEAQGDFCRIYRFDGKAFNQTVTMTALLEQLDSAQFFRINRSIVVSIHYLERIEPYFKNRLALKVAGYPDTVTTSSATTTGFREWLEG